jgi:hypothetical protein
LDWIVLLVRLAAEPSRHRVAVWRELRRGGAVSLGPGAWAAPAAPVFQPALERAAELARRGDGEVLTLDAHPRDGATAALLEAAFRQAREAEWAEFLADCDKLQAKIAKHLRTGKLTAAELEEEEHSLERLRRWHHQLQGRDVLGLPEAVTAQVRLKGCAEVVDDYAERVYRALHGHPTPPAGGEDA